MADTEPRFSLTITPTDSGEAHIQLSANAENVTAAEIVFVILKAAIHLQSTPLAHVPTQAEVIEQARVARLPKAP